MLAKKGMILKLNNEEKYLVDEVHNIKGADFVVLLSLSKKTFHIAKEILENDKLSYKFLDDEKSQIIATLIDERNHKKLNSKKTSN